MKSNALFEMRDCATVSVVLSALISVFVSAADAPIALHPKNPHYFQWKDKPTILITSGEHYGLLLNLDFDFDDYFRELAANELNHTRVFSGAYREVPGSFGISDNTLAPKPNRYAAPWQRSAQPGYFDGGGKFDLTKWDEAYFRRLQAMMQSAKSNGIVVEFNFFCPMYTDELWNACPMNTVNNINGVGNCARNQVLSVNQADVLAVQLALTRKLVQELNAYDNLYFEICNEPYERGVEFQWQKQIIEAVVEAEKQLPNKHLISLNIANGRTLVEKPIEHVSIYNFHYCVPPDAVTLNYHLDKVIGENETGFRGYDDVLYRTEAWDFLFAGGALFNNLDYSFSPAHPRGDLRDFKSPGGGGKELRKQLQVLKRFFDRLDFVGLHPASGIIAQTVPELTSSCLAESDKVYACYFHVPIPNKPKDLKSHLRTAHQAEVALKLPNGKYQLEWISTLAGAVIKHAEISVSTPTTTLSSPPFDNDIALLLRRLPGD